MSGLRYNCPFRHKGATQCTKDYKLRPSIMAKGQKYLQQEGKFARITDSWVAPENIDH